MMRLKASSALEPVGFLRGYMVEKSTENASESSSQHQNAVIFA